MAATTTDETGARNLAELGRVRRNRYLEARRAGMSRDEARVFAHDDQIDVGLLRRLVADGCPGERLAGILL